MSGDAGTMDDLPSSSGAEWWYRAGGGTSGPVTSAELRRLAAAGPLDGETPVWKKGFGGTWRRLVDAVPGTDRPEPPVVDRGRWGRSFAKTEAHPRRAQWSWLGLLGPVGYLCLGMWRRALVVLTGTMTVEIALSFADWRRGSTDHTLADVLTLGFCIWNLKTDYYRFKVLGEPMWPRLRFMTDGRVCGSVAAVALVAAALVPLGNPADALMADVAGVWQQDGENVVIDVAGGDKRIDWGDRRRALRVASVEEDGLVFKQSSGDGKPITLRKRWSDDRSTYTLDLFEGDELLANLKYLKPL